MNVGSSMYGRVQNFHFTQVCPQARDTRSLGWNNYCCRWSGKTIVEAGWEDYFCSGMLVVGGGVPDVGSMVLMQVGRDVPDVS